MEKVTIEEYLKAHETINKYRKYLIENSNTASCLSEIEKQGLSKVYGALWTEGNYDPTSEATREFAKPLSEIMMNLNKTLKFKD